MKVNRILEQSESESTRHYYTQYSVKSGFDDYKSEIIDQPYKKAIATVKKAYGFGKGKEIREGVWIGVSIGRSERDANIDMNGNVSIVMEGQTHVHNELRRGHAFFEKVNSWVRDNLSNIARERGESDFYSG